METGSKRQEGEKKSWRRCAYRMKTWGPSSKVSEDYIDKKTDSTCFVCGSTLDASRLPITCKPSALERLPAVMGALH